MTWRCEDIEARVSEYLDGALGAEDGAAFATHLASCPDCAALAAGVRSLVGTLHSLEPLPVPPYLVSAILEKTLGPGREKQGWRAWFGWSRMLWQPRFAYGALTIFVTAIVLSQALGIEWRRPTIADLNPVNIYHSADRQAHLVYARGAKFVTDLRVVYEIQSRLQPAADPGASPEKAPENKGGTGQSDGPSNGKPNLNRVEIARPHLTQLATAFWFAPRRSMP
ncbi:MAG: anti-sigma factor family protein [Bryobacteraceae bacterium]